MILFLRQSQQWTFCQVFYINKNGYFYLEFKPREGRTLLEAIVIFKRTGNLNGRDNCFVPCLWIFDIVDLELFMILAPLAGPHEVAFESHEHSLIKANLVGRKGNKFILECDLL